MKDYTFKVTASDHFCTFITVQGKNQQDAEKNLEKDLDESPIDTRSNTLVETNLEWHSVPEIENVENLFNPDQEEEIKVIRLDSLNHVQRAFLGLPE
jgi:hypothetical protein